MGKYVNKGNLDFTEARNLEYVDNGYADVVFIPRKGSERPAMVVELKCNGCAAGAIEQIKNRKYPTVVAEFTDDILLVGVNYDKKSKHHECKIERWNKTKGVLPIAKPAFSRSNPEISRSNPEISRSNPEISRSNIENLIAEFCSEPKTLEEIATHLGLKDKYYMKKRYINPILGIRLRMTEPDSPNSPTQKYIAL